MNTQQTVIDVLTSWKAGDKQFATADYEGSVRSYRRALELAESLPADKTFDHRGFEASCYAGLSGSLGRLGMHQESLTAAERALSFFDRSGRFYPAERGKWMMAIVNQGSALAMLGNHHEALRAYSRAKKMLGDEDVADPPTQQWIATVDKNIAAIESVLRTSPLSGDLPRNAPLNRKRIRLIAYAAVLLIAAAGIVYFSH